MDTTYRLAPALRARVVGSAVVAVAVLVFLATMVAAVLHLSWLVIVVVAALGLVGIAVAGWLVSRRLYVVRFSDAGYRVRMVRGAGVTDARWGEVTNAATTVRGQLPCVVLTLEGDRTTTIPVTSMAVDREQFVRDLLSHLRDVQGLRPLDWPTPPA